MTILHEEHTLNHNYILLIILNNLIISPRYRLYVSTGKFKFLAVPRTVFRVIVSYSNMQLLFYLTSP